ncbi:formylglycine-generating enzyme family protein [Leptothermofonsia sichuanensis E412]|nr:formylglycine-generating enzyme family protein [Leptothermofonsia sichuanensis E412]
MVDASQTTISRCVGFGHNLLNENLLSRFDYDRATHTITGKLSSQPEVIPFFNGAWFDRYVAQKILHLLQVQKLSYGYLFKPVVGRPGGDRLEPDLFFLVEGKPILIECQSDPDIDRAVNQLLQYGEHLAIPPQQRVLIVLELTSAQVEHFAHLSSPVVAHRQNFLTCIQAVFGKPPRIDGLEPFTFETATIKAADTSEWVITRQQRQAHQLIENLGNGITLEMVQIPAGSFVMGAPKGEEDSFDNERPQHSVTVPSFFMGRYPVTQAQWRAVAALPQVKRELESDPSHFKGDNRPVERVSWDDAVEFCQRLCQHTGRHYRLPSEAEWEYACRASPLQPGETPGSGEVGSAGTTTPFHFGETITPDLANYDGSYAYGRGPEGTYRQQTTEVGSFPANAFGLYDMHGNVWEWCQDHWHNNYNGAPTDGSAWLTRDENATRVIRGGSWYNYPRLCRSAYRDYFIPDDRYVNIGFRVCCSSPRTL